VLENRVLRRIFAPKRDKGIGEEFYLLGYNAVQSVECQPNLGRNMSPASSGSKKKQSKKPA
jgi:hypothetical protein